MECRDPVFIRESTVASGTCKSIPDGKPSIVEKKDLILRAHDGQRITVPADKKPGDLTITTTPDGKVYRYEVIGPDKVTVNELKPRQYTASSTADGKIPGRLANTADSDARMKALEKRLDELTREVENLRKELKKDGASEPIRSRIRLSEPAK